MDLPGKLSEYLLIENFVLQWMSENHMTEQQKQFLFNMTAEATKANHVFPIMAACEAALESGWGKSLLAIQDRNLFGMKAHKHPVYGVHILPTKEYENGEFVEVKAAFESYPDVAACFSDRMKTLLRLSTFIPHYAAALEAPDAETYIREVSVAWATDPLRASKILAIYQAYTG